MEEKTRVTAAQSMVGIFRYQSLFGRLVKVLDSSEHTTSHVASSAPDLTKFRIRDVFPAGSVFLGFGRPNVFLGLPRKEGGYDKYDAKSLKRAESKIINTRGWAQSGILLKLEATPEMIIDLRSSMESHAGSRSWTCVNANCRLLHSAGFTSGGASLEGFYFPMALAKQIITEGLEYKGNRVETTIVKTTRRYLENFGLAVVRAQFLTICRHTNRKLIKLFPTKRRQQKEPEKITPQNNKTIELEYSHSEDIRKKYRKNRTKMLLSVSEPSLLGSSLRLIWGAHTLFQAKSLEVDVDHFLPEKIKEFPGPKLSFFTRLKKNILFCPMVVKLIRHHLMRSNLVIENPTQEEIFTMLRPHTPERPTKYNLVISGDTTGVIRLNVKYPFVDWLLTKHILTSGYSKDVRFAGEIWKGQDGAIHVNNNSGTYKPDDKTTLSAIAYLGAMFPNVEFVY